MQVEHPIGGEVDPCCEAAADPVEDAAQVFGVFVRGVVQAHPARACIGAMRSRSSRPVSGATTAK